MSSPPGRMRFGQKHSSVEGSKGRQGDCQPTQTGFRPLKYRGSSTFQIIRIVNTKDSTALSPVRPAKAASSLMARYGKFSGVTNYIALAGRKSPDLDERCGYYGEGWLSSWG